MTIENGVLTEVDLSCRHLVFPREMTAISEEVYDNSFCLLNEVETIEVESDNPRYIARNNCLIDTKTGRLVLGCKNSVIPRDNTVTEIGPLAFNGCQELRAIEIPVTVKYLRRMAFACTALEEITIPSSVTRIDALCFALNPSLREIVFKNDVFRLGTAVFGTQGELEHHWKHYRMPDCIFNHLTLKCRFPKPGVVTKYAELYNVDCR